MNWFRRKIQGTGFRGQGTETSLLSDDEKQETVHGREIVSGCVFSSRYDKARGTLLEEKLNLWQQRRYKRPSVLSSIFILLFKNRGAYSPKEHAYSKAEEKYPGVNFPGIGWNEITDNSTCKDNIPYVNTDPRNGLDLVVVQSNHHVNDIIHHLGCQGRYP
jgi:hypothetical protein